MDIMSTENITVVIGTSNKTVIPPTKSDTLKSIRLSPLLCRYHTFGITITSLGRLNLGAMDIFYEEFRG